MAGTGGLLTGVVADVTSDLTARAVRPPPLGDIEIIVSHNDSGLGWTTRTGADGSYELANVPAGALTVVARLAEPSSHRRRRQSRCPRGSVAPSETFLRGSMDAFEARSSSAMDAEFSGPLPRFVSWWPPLFRRMFSADRRLFGATNWELFASADGGLTWSTSGLSQFVNGIASFGDSWFAATSAGVFRSSDLLPWTECSTGLSPGVLAIVATSTGDLIAQESFAPYRSTDGCRSWRQLARPLFRNGFDFGPVTLPLLASDDALGVVGLGESIAQLSVKDRKWMPRVEDAHVTAVARDVSGRYWLGTRAGVWLLSTTGTPWRLESAGLEGPVSALGIDRAGYLLAAVDRGGMF